MYAARKTIESHVAEARRIFTIFVTVRDRIHFVSTQATDGASLAVGTHHGSTRIHMADYSLRHRRAGNAGATILYHLRIYRRQHSSSVTTAGRRELLKDGHRRRFKFRRGRRTFLGTTGRTADDTTTRPSGAGRRVSPTTGTRRQTTCYV